MLETSIYTLTLHLWLHMHSWRVFQPWAYLLGCWATRALCTGCSSDSANCSSDCPWRSPSSVHHHCPNIGRCDAAFVCHHQRTINARFGVPFALPHCAVLSHHHHVDAVNLATPSQRPASPSSCRAAMSSAVPPHYCPVHSRYVLDGRSGDGVTLCRLACEPA